MASNIVPVILCGGAGSRLWPASRTAYPKQFLTLGGELSLFQTTLARVAAPGLGTPLIVTGNDYRFLVAEQLRACGTAGDILLEPSRRDSCAAIAAAALFAAQRDPDALLLVLAADHVIPDREAFHAHVQRAVPAAEQGRIVTFGIAPDHPAIGYGYIQPGAPLAEGSPVKSVARFVEKPDAATAARYVAEGYLWNSGNFLFRAKTFLAELQRLAPDIAEPVAASVQGAQRDLDFVRLDAAAFARARAISVDYAIMEKSPLTAVLPSDFGWSDVGSWSAVWSIASKDAAGNAGEGVAEFFDARDCYVYSPDMLTVALGMEDTVIVTTRDAVLVAAKSRAEDVKALVAALSPKHQRQSEEHLRVFRPWGKFEQIDIGLRHQVKRITVQPGGKLSLQSHFHRAEHWIVVKGTARVTIGDAIHMLGENESVYVPLGVRHRLENPGKIELELIEVQSGSYLGEDDIVRYDDVYDRL